MESVHALARFRVVPTHVNVSVVRKRGESLVQRLVHLLGVAFEEVATTYI